jgi:hypothetical protein
MRHQIVKVTKITKGFSDRSGVFNGKIFVEREAQKNKCVSKKQ